MTSLHVTRLHQQDWPAPYTWPVVLMLGGPSARTEGAVIRALMGSYVVLVRPEDHATREGQRTALGRAARQASMVYLDANYMGTYSDLATITLAYALGRGIGVVARAGVFHSGVIDLVLATREARGSNQIAQRHNTWVDRTELGALEALRYMTVGRNRRGHCPFPASVAAFLATAPAPPAGL